MTKSKILIITGPSGFNKRKLIVDEMIKQIPDKYGKILSTTDKAPSKEETNGEDFLFVTKEEFDGMIDDRDFVEWQLINGVRYGKSKKHVDEVINSSDKPIYLTKINVVNLPVFKRHYPNSISIFVDIKDAKALSEHLADIVKENSTVSHKERVSFATEERRRRHLADFIINYDTDNSKVISDILKIVDQGLLVN